MAFVPDHRDVLDLVLEVAGVSMSDMCQRRITDPSSRVAAWVYVGTCRRWTASSFVQIAAGVGRNHSTTIGWARRYALGAMGFLPHWDQEVFLPIAYSVRDAIGRRPWRASANAGGFPAAICRLRQ